MFDQRLVPARRSTIAKLKDVRSLLEECRESITQDGLSARDITDFQSAARKVEPSDLPQLDPLVRNFI